MTNYMMEDADNDLIRRGDVLAIKMLGMTVSSIERSIRAIPIATQPVADDVTITHMIGMHAVKLAVNLCRIGLFPTVGVDDGGEFVLGPFWRKNGAVINGCASVYWDDTTHQYSWSAYIEIDGMEIRGSWGVNVIPTELTSALIPQPTADPRVVALVEAAKNLADVCSVVGVSSSPSLRRMRAALRAIGGEA